MRTSLFELYLLTMNVRLPLVDQGLVVLAWIQGVTNVNGTRHHQPEHYGHHQQMQRLFKIQSADLASI
jgi:hypothetical protein